MRKRHILLLVAGLFMVYGFQITDTAVLFKSKVKARSYFIEKTEKFERQQRAKCRRAAMKKAREAVDSILVAKNILVDIDSFLLGPKPRRPSLPPLQTRDEPIEAVPIFDSLYYSLLDSAQLDSIRTQDSLRRDTLDH